jgi:hypothetical protein
MAQQAWHRFLSLHYIANVLVIASYLVTREWFIRQSDFSYAKVDSVESFLPRVGVGL